MTNRLRPAEVFPPGDFIREELDVRGWRQADLAEIMGRSTAELSRLINGKIGITEETAQQLGDAFGTGPEYWLGLQNAYNLSQLPRDTAISERAKVYGYAPVREMRRRGWITDTDDLEILQNELCKFFRVPSLEMRPEFAAAARKYDPAADPTSTQVAWWARARQIAEGLRVATYDDSRHDELKNELRNLSAYPKEAARVPETLARYGIRFVIVEPLSGGKIDGAAFWLDEANSENPVIALSTRFDRIDAFWFTLIHEYAHIRFEDGPSFDNDLAGHDQWPSAAKEEVERRADNMASELLVPSDQLDSFIQRTRPYYSKSNIIKFANRIKVHPGIIVGQLQYRGELPWTHLNAFKLQGRFREILLKTAIVDGWGERPQFE